VTSEAGAAEASTTEISGTAHLPNEQSSTPASNGVRDAATAKTPEARPERGDPCSSSVGVPMCQDGMQRCTPKDPFWVLAKAPVFDATAVNNVVSGSALPQMACFHEAAAGFELHDEVEVPESELMTVQLRTREQRLDWRDFLCEAVAGKKAAALFQLYDMEVDPPPYTRPPPSVLTPESLDRWFRNSRGTRLLPCVAPDGAGWHRKSAISRTAVRISEPVTSKASCATAEVEEGLDKARVVEACVAREASSTAVESVTQEIWHEPKSPNGNGSS